jgi:hypothetical protein
MKLKYFVRRVADAYPTNWELQAMLEMAEKQFKQDLLDFHGASLSLESLEFLLRRMSEAAARELSYHTNPKIQQRKIRDCFAAIQLVEGMAVREGTILPYNTSRQIFNDFMRQSNLMTVEEAIASVESYQRQIAG